MSGFETLPPDLKKLRPVQVLEKNMDHGQLAHAILLKGDDLLQLETVAQAIAASLLKTREHPELHPDYFTLRPAKKARMIRIGNRDGTEPNTMRKLVHDLQQSSNRGGFKLALVYEADRMNDAAANAFLKTLEEPPPQTVILLLSTRPYDLLATIRSRCFQFRLPVQPKAQQNEEWMSWVQDYKAWVHNLNINPREVFKKPTEAVLGSYGLIYRFSSILAKISEEAWKAEKQRQPDYLDEDELLALETGVRKGIRDQLIVEIENATREAVIELSHKIPYPANGFSHAIESLEETTGLLTLNMKEEATLEHFFHKSLKAWTRAAIG